MILRCLTLFQAGKKKKRNGVDNGKTIIEFETAKVFIRKSEYDLASGLRVDLTIFRRCSLDNGMTASSAFNFHSLKRKNFVSGTITFSHAIRSIR